MFVAHPEPPLEPENCQDSLAWLPRPATVTVRFPERLFKNLTGGDSSHYNHRAQGDILQNHGDSLTVAISRHLMGLSAKVIQVIERWYGHGMIGSQLEWNFLSGPDSLFLANHLANLLIESLSFDAGAHSGFWPDLV